MRNREETRGLPYVFLLFMDMSDLEPDIFFSQGAGGISDNVFEALIIEDRLA